MVINRSIKGHLHQQSFVFCHNTSKIKQHRNAIGFYVLQNFNPFGFHKLYKLCELQMLLRALKKIVVWGLKQTFKFSYHLQVWQSLNYQIGSMGHTMNPYGMWNPNIKNLLSNTSWRALKSLVRPKRVQLCQRMEIVGTWCCSQLPALKGVRGACWKLQD
jgi:hypothetical protein